MVISPPGEQQLLGIPFHHRWVMNKPNHPCTFVQINQTWRPNPSPCLQSLHPAGQVSFHPLGAILCLLGALWMLWSTKQSRALHRLIISVAVHASGNSRPALGSADCKTQACGKCVLITTFLLD